MKDLIYKIKKNRSYKGLVYLVDMLNDERCKIPQYNPRSEIITYDITDDIGEYVVFNVNDDSKRISYQRYSAIEVLRGKFYDKNISYDAYNKIIVRAIKLSIYSDYSIW